MSENVKKVGNNLIIKIIFVFLSFVVCIGIVTFWEDIQWAKTKMFNNNLAGYMTYYYANPGGKYEMAVKERIDAFLWVEVERNPSFEAYEKYLEKTPWAAYSDNANFKKAVNHVNTVLFEAAAKVDTRHAYYEYLEKTKEYQQDKEKQKLAIARLAEMENAAYKEAENTNTIEAYNSYLEEWGTDAEHAWLASDKIEDIYFEKAGTINTIDAYETFIKLSPRAKLQGEARRRIDALQFKKAKATNTLAAYEAFIRSASDYDLKRKARHGIDQLRFEAAKYTIQGCEEFKRTAHTSEYQTKADERIEYLLAEKALSNRPDWKKDIEQYLEKYPEGRYVEKIKEQKAKLYYVEAIKAYLYGEVGLLERYLREFEDYPKYTKLAVEQIVKSKWKVTTKDEIVTAVEFYNLFLSPMRERKKFRAFLGILKHFSAHNDCSKILSWKQREFLNESVFFTTRRIYIKFQGYHHRKECSDLLCTKFKYPRTKDYYAGVIEKNDVVVYDEYNRLMRTVFALNSTNGRKNFKNFIELAESRDDSTKFVNNFRFAYKLCESGTDGSYAVSEGEPLEFQDAFGEIDKDKTDINFEAVTTLRLPETLSEPAKMGLVAQRHLGKSEDIISKTFRGVGNVTEGLLNLVDQ